jgi:hypothetical protein
MDHQSHPLTLEDNVKIISSVAALAFLAFAAQAAVPGNEAEGKRLHDVSCTGCHDTGVYTRKEHRVKSMAGLMRQVENCTHMSQQEFSPAEKQDIVKYLNDQFYKFE